MSLGVKKELVAESAEKQVLESLNCFRSRFGGCLDGDHVGIKLKINVSLMGRSSGAEIEVSRSMLKRGEGKGKGCFALEGLANANSHYTILKYSVSIEFYDSKALRLRCLAVVLLLGIVGKGEVKDKFIVANLINQFILVDLRCHGDSASIKKRGPHTVDSAALDVLKLLGQLRVTPRVLVGHSFGGKVALSMVEQAAKPLARPVRVWVLDATPGKVRAGGDGDDHPAELISFLAKLPKEISSKRDVVNALVQEGFSVDVAQIYDVHAVLLRLAWFCDDL
ncbi:unnamed protein product [Ilex paraguariensis]|uniref:AB hydrolase-1 domain-containing protein n=1 Tax=Ilex paraguariensis TaxID=185542 RepID=A0ABC8S4Z1_9AQUA